MGAVDESRTEYGWEFDDGEVWDGFQTAAEVIAYITDERDTNPTQRELYDGHVVQRTRRLVIDPWSHVTPVPTST
jgi:hypothetical protein